MITEYKGPDRVIGVCNTLVSTGFGGAIFIEEQEGKERGLNFIMNECRTHKFSDEDLMNVQSS